MGRARPVVTHPHPPEHAKAKGIFSGCGNGRHFSCCVANYGKNLCFGSKIDKASNIKSAKKSQEGGKHKRHPFASHRRHACRARIGGGPKRLSQTTDLHSGRISGRRVYGRTCARAGAGEAQDAGAGFHHYQQGRYSMSCREGRRRSR